MTKKKSRKGSPNLIELTVMTSLPLLLLRKENMAFSGIGTGVMIYYRERFFFCTVQHNIQNPELILNVDVSKPKQGELKTIRIDGFTTITSHQVAAETLSPSEAIEITTTENTLDIAFGEIARPFVVPQLNTTLHFDGEEYIVPEGTKIPAMAERGVDYNMSSDYSFYGRIKPSLIGGVEIETEERFIAGMKLSAVLDFWLKFDLGEPIADHKNFKGCSGAPIFNFDGNLVALLANGDGDVSQPYIYGFRVDKLLAYIDMAYFEDSHIPIEPPHQQ